MSDEFGSDAPYGTPRKPSPYKPGDRITRFLGPQTFHGVVEKVNDEWMVAGHNAYQTLLIRLDDGQPRLSAWLGWMPDPQGKLASSRSRK